MARYGSLLIIKTIIELIFLWFFLNQIDFCIPIAIAFAILCIIFIYFYFKIVMFACIAWPTLFAMRRQKWKEKTQITK